MVLFVVINKFGVFVKFFLGFCGFMRLDFLVLYARGRGA